jgi:hypothetical protein
MHLNARESHKIHVIDHVIDRLVIPATSTFMPKGGCAKMYLNQADLFTGLGHDYLQKTMAIAEKVSFDKGEFVFHNGFVFFKHLCEALGSRLMQMYRHFSEKAQAAAPD